LRLPAASLAALDSAAPERFPCSAKLQLCLDEIVLMRDWEDGEDKALKLVCPGQTRPFARRARRAGPNAGYQSNTDV
jgi:hypothetical protein